jgi:hypothetical protein
MCRDINSGASQCGGAAFRWQYMLQRSSQHWPFAIAVVGATFAPEPLANFRHHGGRIASRREMRPWGSLPAFFRRVSGPFFQPSQNKDAKNNTCAICTTSINVAPCNVGTACVRTSRRLFVGAPLTRDSGMRDCAIARIESVPSPAAPPSAGPRARAPHRLGFDSAACRRRLEQ